MKHEQELADGDFAAPVVDCPERHPLECACDACQRAGEEPKQ